LIVDDIPTNLRILYDYLAQFDFEIFSAKSGEKVLKMITQIKPDIILLDVMMPGIDGFETCRRLKENEETREIPVIFMTALSDTKSKVKGFEVGGVDYITKLLQQEEVLARVNTHLTIRDQQKKLEAQKEELRQLNASKDRLLLNILPSKIVEYLKTNGKTEPETFENVSVFFSDFVGFTKISSNLDSKRVIDELSDIFTNFDEIMDKNQCERIKTIGDAYLAVCGMPELNPNHAKNLIKAAIKIIDYLKVRNQKSEFKWLPRIGIHSGKVVGGIVGIKKYIYDVFGDIINTASRMESYSETMKINVSETTYQLVKNDFRFVERETLLVKGKGEMKMYFVK
jgi:class 3 adenylate cyclase